MKGYAQVDVFIGFERLSSIGVFRGLPEDDINLLCPELTALALPFFGGQYPASGFRSRLTSLYQQGRDPDADDQLELPFSVSASADSATDGVTFFSTNPE